MRLADRKCGRKGQRRECGVFFSTAPAGTVPSTTPQMRWCSSQATSGLPSISACITCPTISIPGCSAIAYCACETATSAAPTNLISVVPVHMGLSLSFVSDLAVARLGHASASSGLSLVSTFATKLANLPNAFIALWAAINCL